jgi:hypothetical protein
MRTTLRIDDNLMQQAKRIAADSGCTLTAVIEDALREAFVRRAASQSKRKVELPTFGSGGLMPGVDINDSAGLLDVMEADDDPV